MRIDGAGGCFDNRLYEVDIDVAWNIALLCVNEMGVTIDEQDDAAHQPVSYTHLTLPTIAYV